MALVEKEKKQLKAVVAMSGGVDSSVAAALLIRQRYKVVGVFMRFWSPEKQKSKKLFENRCCSEDSEKRARLTAQKLGIPFYVLNLEQEFKKKVVDYFLKANKQGLTPNPCVVCNKEIKFGLLLEKTLKLGADYAATGHYAKVFQAKDGKKIKYILAAAKDKDKDQSYFLWKLKQAQLRRVLFPVGDYTKTEVKTFAKKLGLPVVEAKESMEVCFIEKTINDFLKEQIGEKQGAVINEAGELLSQHKGLWFYTIGQRKGILLSKGPYYVLGKDIKKNILIVTKNERKLYKKRMVAKGLNWILGEKPKLPLKVKAKIRYRQRAENAKIFWDSKLKSYLIEFNKAQRAITPGQSVVFYSLDSIVSGQAKQGGAVKPTKKKSGQLDRASRVLGGAIIKKAL